MTATPPGFEWDEKKRTYNIFKHGIDFAWIPEAFQNPRIEDFDRRHSKREDRWKVLGYVRGLVVFFVYCDRGGRRRIITARLATRREAGLYYSHYLFAPKSR